jgi:hypothetical protein
MGVELPEERHSNEVEKMNELDLPYQSKGGSLFLILEDRRRETSRIITAASRFLMAYAIRLWTRHINWKLGGVGGRGGRGGRKEVIQQGGTGGEKTEEI